MTYIFNPPPSWPAVPEGWVPPKGWTPPASWPAAPDGWDFWVEDTPQDSTINDGYGPSGNAPVPPVEPKRNTTKIIVVTLVIVGLFILCVPIIAVPVWRHQKDEAKAVSHAYITVLVIGMALSTGESIQDMGDNSITVYDDMGRSDNISKSGVVITVNGKHLLGYRQSLSNMNTVFCVSIENRYDSKYTLMRNGYIEPVKDSPIPCVEE